MNTLRHTKMQLANALAAHGTAAAWAWVEIVEQPPEPKMLPTGAWTPRRQHVYTMRFTDISN